MKNLLFLLIIIPAACYSQDSISRSIQPDSIKLKPIENDYAQMEQEGVDILMAGIVMNVTSFGLLFSGPLSEIGVGTLFTINQTVGITLDVIGIIKIIRAKKRRNKESP